MKYVVIVYIDRERNGRKSQTSRSVKETELNRRDTNAAVQEIRNKLAKIPVYKKLRDLCDCKPGELSAD